MTDNVPPPSGDSGDQSVNDELQAMDAEFDKAIKAQMALTLHKTEDDSKLDASKQRPSG
jgi:hypothetical protein